MYLIDSFTSFKNYNHIDGVTLITILEYSIRNTILNKYRSVDNFDIFIDYENGSIDIWRNRIIVYNIQEYNKEIEFLYANHIEDDLKMGEEVTEQFFLKLMDRRYILTFKYNFYLKSKEYYNMLKYLNFKTRIGDLVVGQVFHARKDLIILDNHNNDMLLPKQEQMFNDFMHKRESIRAVIKNVYWEDSKPLIILSRTVPNFIHKLFEQEIPEILDGFIIIKQVVRIPGEKSKVSVESSDPYIEPIRACLGIKNIRIYAIVKESENIDIIKYSNNTKLYILRALNPIKIYIIEIDEQNKIAMISLKYEQVFKATVQNGKNIRLVERLTGYKINILRNYYFLYNKNEEEISKFKYEFIQPNYNSLKFNKYFIL